MPLTLGSDTNGSIRVPASLCGVFGLKPTFGRLPRTGSFPFVGSLDHVGPFAADAKGLAAVYDALQGPDAGDGACAQRPVEPTLAALASDRPLRVAVLGGYFAHWAGPRRARPCNWPRAPSTRPISSNWPARSKRAPPRS